VRPFLVPFVFAAVTLAVAVDPPAQPPADPCEAWSLFGYRIGMTRTEAVALHGGRFHRKSKLHVSRNGESHTAKFSDLHPVIVKTPYRSSYFKDPPPFDPELIVRFDKDGDQAIAVLARTELEPGEAKIDLIGKFGPPSAEGLLRKAGPWSYSDDHVEETRWESTACDSDFYIAITITTLPTGERYRETHLVLARHGRNYEDVRSVQLP